MLCLEFKKKVNLFDDLQDGDIIIHGCNCFNTMGSGFAADLKQRFPGAYQADQQTIKGDRSKLGSYTKYGSSESDCVDVIVINLYTQYQYFPRGVDHFEYVHFHNALEKLLKQYKNKRFKLPKIGAGLAGGDWGRIEKIITELLLKYITNNNTITIYSL